MHPSLEYMRLQREREVLAQFRRKFHADMAAFAFRLALVRFAQSQDYQRRFDPAQPRDENGRWTDGGGAVPRASDPDTPDPQDEATLDEGVNTDLASEPDEPQLILAAGTDDATYSVDLQKQDALGGHGFSDHVSQTPKALIDEVEAKARRASDPNREGWAEGSFTDKYNANNLVNTVLRNNKEMVDRVRSGQSSGAILRERMGFVTGYEAYKPTRDAPAIIRPTYSVRVLIRPSKQSPTGYYVHTAFPMNMGFGGQ